MDRLSKVFQQERAENEYKESIFLREVDPVVAFLLVFILIAAIIL